VDIAKTVLMTRSRRLGCPVSTKDNVTASPPSVGAWKDKEDLAFTVVGGVKLPRLLSDALERGFGNHAPPDVGGQLVELDHAIAIDRTAPPLAACEVER
jgi:hypothetical protein